MDFNCPADQQLPAEILKLLDISNPTQFQIDLIESILTTVSVKKHIYLDSRLSRKEMLCLFWAAKGKTSLEISRLLHIQKCTVDGHKREILRKLECSNIAQAIFEGIRFGYLEGKNY